MRLTWIGGPTARIEIGAFRLLTDPMLGEGEQAFVMRRHPITGEYNVPVARLAPLPPVDLEDLDGVIVSHLHSDHFDARAVERLTKDLNLVAPTPNLPQLQEWGFRRVTALNWRDDLAWDKEGERLRITAVTAHHSHDEQASHELGVVNGYLIEHQAAGSVSRIYWTGDTVLSDALHEVAAALPEVHLLMPHLGAVGKDSGGPWGMISMDAAEGTRLTGVVNPRTVLPIHHSTFSFYVEPISIFRDHLGESGYAGRLVVLREGESWTDCN